jgi:hypothetical protein
MSSGSSCCGGGRSGSSVPGAVNTTYIDAAVTDGANGGGGNIRGAVGGGVCEGLDGHTDADSTY